MSPRLRWRCRRGMRELDVLLGRFLEQRCDALTEQEMGCFETILELPDPELYGYLFGRVSHPDPDVAALIAGIRDHSGP